MLGSGCHCRLIILMLLEFSCTSPAWFRFCSDQIRNRFSEFEMRSTEDRLRVLPLCNRDSVGAGEASVFMKTFSGSFIFRIASCFSGAMALR